MGRILVTGGAGYVGSQVAKTLGEKGYQIIVYDNLSTGHKWAVLYGDLVVGDVLDARGLKRVFTRYEIDAVIHCAARVVVSESIARPLPYYITNLAGTLNLLQVMRDYGVKNFIFSSTAAVYGIPEEIPVRETASLMPINPYGQSKAMAEKALVDLSRAEDFRYIILRYFNVAGADSRGQLGEGKPEATHLITMGVRTAAGLRPWLEVYGSDYPTPDGTCIRDYIHVEDLANIHVLSLQYLLGGGAGQIFNCGYSRGFSVLEVIKTIKKVTGVNFTVKMSGRRVGDPPMLMAECNKIKEYLHWYPEHDDLNYIIETAWNWELGKSGKGW